MSEPSVEPLRPRERSRSPLNNAYFEYINFCSLCRYTTTQSDCIKFVQYFGLLPRSVLCKSCGLELKDLKQREGRLEFRCEKRSCKVKISAKKGTWFEKSKLSLKKSLFLIYMFVNKTDLKTAIKETSGPEFDNQTTSSETVVDIFCFCREVCIESLFASDVPKKIGGTDLVIEIDEANFGKRKCNKGRALNEQWVLGGICRETKECFFVPITSRDQETLLGVIEERVEKGSIILTDEGEGYRNLSEKGYTHVTVNHSKHLIESTWWSLKRSLASSLTRENLFAGYLAEYVWRRKHQDAKCVFTAFLQEVAEVFPGI